MPKLIVAGTLAAAVAASSLFVVLRTAAASPPHAHLTWANVYGFQQVYPATMVVRQPDVEGYTSRIIGLLAEDNGSQPGYALTTQLQVPTGFKVTGLRVCMQRPDASSAITALAVSQLRFRPMREQTLLEEHPSRQPSSGCFDSDRFTADPRRGPVRVYLSIPGSSAAPNYVFLDALGIWLLPD